MKTKSKKPRPAKRPDKDWRAKLHAIQISEPKTAEGKIIGHTPSEILGMGMARLMAYREVLQAQRKAALKNEAAQRRKVDALKCVKVSPSFWAGVARDYSAKLNLVEKQIIKTKTQPKHRIGVQIKEDMAKVAEVNDTPRGIQFALKMLSARRNDQEPDTVLEALKSDKWAIESMSHDSIWLRNKLGGALIFHYTNEMKRLVQFAVKRFADRMKGRIEELVSSMSGLQG